MFRVKLGLFGFKLMLLRIQRFNEVRITANDALQEIHAGGKIPEITRSQKHVKIVHLSVLIDVAKPFFVDFPRIVKFLFLDDKGPFITADLAFKNALLAFDNGKLLFCLGKFLPGPDKAVHGV